MPVERPDWTGPNHYGVSADAEPSSSVMLSPEEGQAIVDQVIANSAQPGETPAHAPVPVPDLDPALVTKWERSHDGFDATLATVQGAADDILSKHPDPGGFAASFDTLPVSVQGKVFDVLASRPNLRGVRLIDAVMRKLTLEETVAVNEWEAGG